MEAALKEDAAGQLKSNSGAAFRAFMVGNARQCSCLRGWKFATNSMIRVPFGRWQTRISSRFMKTRAGNQ